MNTDKLPSLSIQQLLDLYSEKGIEQYEALEGFNTKKFNRIFRLTCAIEDELKSRPGDERRALLSLYGHSNLQVRLNVAKATRMLAPELSREMLQAIRALKWNPQSLDAGMSLWAWDEGIWKAD